VAKQANGPLAAHAWVTSGENIVTGNLPNLLRCVLLPIDVTISRFLV